MAAPDAPWLAEPPTPGADDQPDEALTGEFSAPAGLTLNWLDSEGRSQRHVVGPEELTIGRVRGNDIVVRDRRVSRHHVSISTRNGAVYVRDLDSRNGTFLNGERVQGERRLRPGDRLEVGRVSFELRAERAGDATVVAPVVEGPGAAVAATRSAAEPAWLSLPLADAPRRHLSRPLEFPEQSGALVPAVGVPQGEGTVVTFFSLKGGVGVSTLAVNFAIELRQAAAVDTVLADLSAERGHAALLLNVVPKRTLADLARQDMSQLNGLVLSDYLAAHETGLRLLPAPLSPTAAELVSSTMAGTVLPLLKARGGWVVVDCSSSFSDLVLTAFDHSDIIVLVTTPEICSLHSVRHCLEIFPSLGIPRERVVLTVNEVLPGYNVTRQGVEQAIKARVDEVIPYGGEKVVLGAQRGTPLAAREPEHPWSIAVATLARKVTNIDALAPGRTRREGLITKIKKWF